MAEGGKVPFFLVVLVLASALASPACGKTERARAESAETDTRAEQERGAEVHQRAAGTVAGGDGTDRAVARAGRVAIMGNSGRDAQESKVESKSGPQKVTLRISGAPGTGFSGACSVGGDERALDGRTPERYAFDLDGKKLECGIRKEGAGALEVALTDRDSARSVQQIGAGEGTVRFAYSGGGVSSSSISMNQKAVTSFDGSSPDNHIGKD